MTREEIEKFSRVEPNCFETDREEEWYKIGCIDGLDAADAYIDTSSLWHDASEEPENGSHILMQYNYFGDKEYKSFHNEYDELINWEKLVKIHDISQWAYISDLLPKGGEQ